MAENTESREHSEDTNTQVTKIFSLGFRCSSASILKKMGLKHESFPFDWLVSRLSVIQHCIQNNFCEFLHREHYIRKYSNTYEMTDSLNGFVCDEHLMVNMFYQPPDMPDCENTYQYRLAMNHHNITEDKDYEYYGRCVDRFRELLRTLYPKKYLHICPLITFAKYQERRCSLLKELTEFDEFMCNATSGTASGLFFIMVRDDIETCRRELLYYSTQTKSKIYVIYANKWFVDAGEVFMGHDGGERRQIENIIREHM